MILLLAFVLAVFVLPSPWGLVAVGVAVCVELAEVWLWWRWSKGKRAAIGLETMLGRPAIVVQPCRPRGQVRIDGELWQARCDEGADAGERVRVERVDGLVLHVSPA